MPITTLSPELNALAKQIAGNARQSITTRYLGATNYRPSRIVATSASGHKLTRSVEDEYNIAENSARVALALAESLGWMDRNTGSLGATKDGYVLTLTSTR